MGLFNCKKTINFDYIFGFLFKQSKWQSIIIFNRNFLFILKYIIRLLFAIGVFSCLIVFFFVSFFV